LREGEKIEDYHIRLFHNQDDYNIGELPMTKVAGVLGTLINNRIKGD